MKAVINKANNRVLYLVENSDFVGFVDNGLRIKSTVCLDIKEETHKIIDNVPKPWFGFVGNKATYSKESGWEIFDKDFLKEVSREFSEDNFILEARTIVSKFSDEERETWAIQIEEAKAYQADPAAPTLLLDGIISESGESKADLVARILTKDAVFRTAVGKALGRKRKG